MMFEKSADVDRLEKIVSKFNKDFEQWSKDTGMVAKFGWKYGAEKFPKNIEVLGVDKIIFRKRPPQWREMADKLGGKDVKETAGEADKAGDSSEKPGRGGQESAEEQRHPDGVYTTPGLQGDPKGTATSGNTGDI